MVKPLPFFLSSLGKKWLLCPVTETVAPWVDIGGHQNQGAIFTCHTFAATL